MLEKLGGLDWYDLRILDCTLDRDPAGRPRHCTLKVQSRGRRKVIRRVPLTTSGLAGALSRAGRLKIAPADEPAFRAGVRAARLVLALRDAVLHHPEIAEPRALLQILNTCRRAQGKTEKAEQARRRLLTRLGKAPVLGGRKGAHRAYGTLLPGNRGIWAGTRPAPGLGREVQKCLIKARDKIRTEAEKNGLLIPPGQELLPGGDTALADPLLGELLGGPQPEKEPAGAGAAGIGAGPLAAGEAETVPEPPQAPAADWDDDDL